MMYVQSDSMRSETPATDLCRVIGPRRAGDGVVKEGTREGDRARTALKALSIEGDTARLGIVITWQLLLTGQLHAR